MCATGHMDGEGDMVRGPDIVYFFINKSLYDVEGNYKASFSALAVQEQNVPKVHQVCLHLQSGIQYPTRRLL